MMRRGTPETDMMVSTTHVEVGWRGHVEYKVTFRPTGRVDIEFDWINSDRSNRRAMRGLRRAKKHLAPIIDMWIKSEYRFCIDLHDFVLGALGTTRSTPRIK